MKNPEEAGLSLETSELAPADRQRRRPEPTPVQRALSLLVRREHSRKELTRKLTARGVDGTAAEAAVARLAEEGWQDDARFGELLVRSRAGSGYGPRYIQVELESHGLEPAQVTAAMATFEGSWPELALDLIARRFGPDGPQELPQQRKAADLLMRRGFDGSVVRKVLRRELDD